MLGCAAVVVVIVTLSVRVTGFPHEVKGSGLFCHVTLNFNWIEAALPADSAHVLTASDEAPSKITFWCPSFEQ